MFNKEVYIRRRQQLKEKVGSGLILLIGNEESSINYTNNWYPFRQDSSFLYFMGLDKARLAAVIDIDDDIEILFGDELSVDDILWNGHQQPLIEQAERSGIQTVKPFGSLKSYLNDARFKDHTIHFLPAYLSL